MRPRDVSAWLSAIASGSGQRRSGELEGPNEKLTWKSGAMSPSRSAMVMDVVWWCLSCDRWMSEQSMVFEHEESCHKSVQADNVIDKHVADKI